MLHVYPGAVRFPRGPEHGGDHGACDQAKEAKNLHTRAYGPHQRTSTTETGFKRLRRTTYLPEFCAIPQEQPSCPSCAAGVAVLARALETVLPTNCGNQAN
jgi:hypothetical protein